MKTAVTQQEVNERSVLSALEQLAIGDRYAEMLEDVPWYLIEAVTRSIQFARVAGIEALHINANRKNLCELVLTFSPTDLKLDEDMNELDDVILTAKLLSKVLREINPHGIMQIAIDIAVIDGWRREGAAVLKNQPADAKSRAWIVNFDQALVENVSYHVRARLQWD